MTRPLIRKKLWDDAKLGEHARDVQAGFDLLPETVFKFVENYYAEPLTLGGDDVPRREPLGVELLRILNLNAPDTPVLTSGLCSWVWRPDLGGIRVLSINGLTPDISIKYRMTFRLTYPPLNAV